MSDLHVKVPVDDEFTGPVELHFVFREEDLPKVLAWKPGVAQRYLGFVGREVQYAIRKAVDAVDG